MIGPVPFLCYNFLERNFAIFMFLKSISIQGFKSFAKKVTLDLSSEVTGVVGPNGSGKSNIAEAIRFVLGEQSMKGLRSKSGSDLIFKGSANLSQLSQASVSIYLDNSRRNKKTEENNFKIISNSSSLSPTNDIFLNFLNLDEIIVSRKIYADGQSEYTINNLKVRLKDVQELLALAQISAAGHTIINQGEADKILLASSKERREILEEALSLRIYHIRIKDSEKKLEKVSEHLREIDLIRKENLPHLQFLKRQKEKLENREKEVENISALLKIYLSREDKEILELQTEIEKVNLDFQVITKYKKEIQDLELQKSQPEKPTLDSELEEQNKIQNQLQENLQQKLQKDLLETLIQEISQLQNKLNLLNTNYDNLYKETINLDLEIKFLERQSQNQKFMIAGNKLDTFEINQKPLWQKVLQDYQQKLYENSQNNLEKLKLNEEDLVKDFVGEHDLEKISQIKIELISKQQELEKLQQEKNNLVELKEQKNTEKKNLEKETEKELEKAIERRIQKEIEDKNNSANRNNIFEIENKILSLKLNLQEIENKRENLEMKNHNFKMKEENFQNILSEINVLIGINGLSYKTFRIDGENNYLDDNLLSDVTKKIITENLKYNQFELFRKIERSKIKIEETGLTNGQEILQEYNSLRERDEFLSQEISDLIKSKTSLQELILDLQKMLETDLHQGLKMINQNFNNYFGEIFAGGKAGLILEDKRVQKKQDEQKENLNENEDRDGDRGEEDEEQNSGIEISISLPQKKINNLQMLSGGERALTSIALIFAMSSLNHPPFIVLDETDAALDESNAKRYGKMIVKLSKTSKLLVITHNRETMQQCDVLYGVTIGAEGSSKLLSIKFDQAKEYVQS